MQIFLAQDQGTANALLSDVSISIDWAAGSLEGGEGDNATTAAAAAAADAADVTSVVVKIGDVDLKFAGDFPFFTTANPKHFTH